MPRHAPDRWPMVALAVCAGALASCGYDRQPSPETVARAQRAQQWSVVAAPVDTDVDPCDDFYRHACNAWIEANQASLTQPMTGRGLDAIHQQTRLWLWQRLSAPAAAAAGDPLALLYASCLDEDAATDRGLRDLAPLFAAIDAGTEPSTLLRAVALLQRAGISPLFGAVAYRDWTASNQNLLLITPTWLPPQAFAGDDVPGALAQNRYLSYAKLTLADVDEVTDANTVAAHALTVERRLAAVTPQRAPAIDAERLDRAAFDQLAAPLPMGEYFSAAGFASPNAVALADPTYFQAVRQLIIDQGATVQDYLRWALVRAIAPELPGVIRDVRFGYERPAEVPRWQRCVDVTERTLPDEVARLYEREAVTADVRTAVEKLAVSVQGAAVRRLETATWLDPAARAAAADKVEHMEIRISRPSAAPAPSLQAGTYIANLLAANEQRWIRMAMQLGSGPDPRVGMASPSTANAFYRHERNDVIVPLALAQPPFFSLEQSAAANYGALGSTVGHEIAHAFDRIGRQLDAGGRQTDWAAGSDETVRARERCLSERLSQEEAAPRYDSRGIGGVNLLPATTVDAERTADEHLADVAGLTYAYDAYRGYTAVHPEMPTSTAGSDRLFFLAYAQSWCSSMHPLTARRLSQIDTHAPAAARVNATVAQMPEFGAAYDCAVGSTLRPARICSE